MNKKHTMGIIIGAAVVILVTGFNIAQKPKRATDVSIGLILPMTDFLKSYGENALKGAQDAIKDQTGIKLVVEDDKCQSNSALSAFKKLTEVNHADLIIGPLCGSPQEAVAPLLKNVRIPIILPAAASSNLFNQSDGTMFNIQYSLENEGKAIADRMYADGHKKAVVITYKNGFSESETKGFVSSYKGEVVKQIVFGDNTSDIRTELVKLKSLDFDAVFVSEIAFFFSKGNNLMQQYGLDQQLYSPYPVEDPSARPLAEHVIYSYPGDIISEYGATYGLAYAAVKKAVAVARSCNSNKECMIEKLSKDDDFDGAGTSIRGILFKKIISGQPVGL